MWVRTRVRGQEVDGDGPWILWILRDWILIHKKSIIRHHHCLVRYAGKPPVVGVIHLPMLGLTYAGAKGQGTTCQEKALHLSENLPIEKAIIGVGDFAQFSSAKRETDYHQLLTMSGYVRGYTDCFGHSLVVSGALGAMVRPGPEPVGYPGYPSVN